MPPVELYRFRPNYDWVKGSADDAFQRQFDEQYSKFCKERNIAWDGYPFFYETEFLYTPPPENTSLAFNSPQVCGVQLVAGSLRYAPKVPLETEWKSVDEYIPDRKRMIPLEEAQAPAPYPEATGQDPVSGTSLYSNRFSELNPTQQRALSFADDSTMANVFYIRAGTWANTQPSLTNRNGMPFTGVFNVLSQTYDANITMQDLQPEWRDPRFIAPDPDESDSALVSDMLKPDSVFTNSNRYTQLVGVTKDPITGGYMLYYGRDDQVDYAGKVYSAPPTVNLGSPDPFFDLMTNTGTRPNTRGTMIVKKPIANDYNQAVAPTNGFLNNALRDSAMQLGGRGLINKRQENIYPEDSRVNVNNPNYTFQQYGNFGTRSMLSSSNFAKIVNYDIFNQTLEATPNTQYYNYGGTPMQNREQRAFLREGDSQDIFAASGNRFMIQDKTKPQYGVDAMGFSDGSSSQNARAYAITQPTTAQPQIDAKGFQVADDVYLTRTHAMAYPFAERSVVDASGFVTTDTLSSARPAPAVGTQMDKSFVDATGYVSNAQMMNGATRGNVGSYASSSNAGVDATGFVTGQAGATRYYSPVGLYQAQPTSAIDAYGFLSSENIQTYKQYSVGPQQNGVQAVDPLGLFSNASYTGSRARGNMSYTVRADQVDGMGMTSLETMGVQRRGDFGVQAQRADQIDAMGLSQTASQNAARHRTNQTYTQQSYNVGIDGAGFSSSSFGFSRNTANLTYNYTFEGVDAYGNTDSSNMNTFGYNYNLGALSGQYSAQAEKSIFPDVKETIDATDVYKNLQNPFAASIYSEKGAPLYYVPDVKMSYNYSLLPIALTMNESLPALTGMGSSAVASERIANTQQGGAMTQRAINQMLVRGKQDLVSQGIVNLTNPEWSDGDASPTYPYTPHQ